MQTSDRVRQAIRLRRPTRLRPQSDARQVSNSPSLKFPEKDRRSIWEEPMRMRIGLTVLGCAVRRRRCPRGPACKFASPGWRRSQTGSRSGSIKRTSPNISGKSYVFDARAFRRHAADGDGDRQQRGGNRRSRLFDAADRHQERRHGRHPHYRRRLSGRRRRLLDGPLTTCSRTARSRKSRTSRARSLPPTPRAAPSTSP